MKMRRPTKTIAAFLLLVLGLSACQRDTVQEQKLRGFINASDRIPHAFDYTEAAADRWFEVKGAVADDLRYRFTLASPKGDLAEFVIVDDALAVRLLQPELFKKYAAQMGFPQTVDALMAGQWVEDPAGAPPLSPPRSDASAREAPDPLDVGTRLMRVVITEMGQSRAIKEWSLDDIEYKPTQDPWRYPDKASGEVRYDLIRPILPTREDQVQQGNITIGESQFRKTSAFVKDGRIGSVCEMVDVVGHEEFVKNKESGDKNAFLKTVLTQVLEGRTESLVRPRSAFVRFDYPASVSVELPRNAVKAQLGLFLVGLRAAFKAGLIAPPGPVPAACLRIDEAPQPNGTPSA